MRIGGGVLPGSIHAARRRRRLRSHRGRRDGARASTTATEPSCSRTARRSWPTGIGQHGIDTFDSDQILIKHGSTYDAAQDTPSDLPGGSVRQRHEGAARLRPARDRHRGRGARRRDARAGHRARTGRAARLGTPLRRRRAAVGRSARSSSWRRRCSRHDFSIKYVADNVARATPGLYTFTAAWGALEGSILLWALVLSVYVAVTTWRFRERRRRSARRVGDARAARRACCSSSC